MADTKMEDSQIKITVTPPLPYNSALVQKLDSLMRAWCMAYGITHFDFKQSNDPNVYSYKFEHGDGRKWNQDIDFSVNPTDPVMTLNVGDWWKVTEFMPHRAIRDLVVQMRNDEGLTSVKVDVV